MIVLVFACSGIFQSGDEDRSVAPAAVAHAPALGTQERLRHEITEVLGSSNREGVMKVKEIDVRGDAVTVRFAIDDNLTEGYIKSGAKVDIVAILKAVQASGFSYRTVTVAGSFSMADKLGNASEDEVLRVTYQRSTVERINWSGFDNDNLYDIGESVWLHPAFR
ncbi:MAG: hypothetical protein WED34_04785 [Planctomycetales bacterium]